MLSRYRGHAATPSNSTPSFSATQRSSVTPERRTFDTVHLMAWFSDAERTDSEVRQDVTSETAGDKPTIVP